MRRCGVVLASVLAGLSERLGGADRGATAVEYGLIVALIAAVIAVIVATLGTQVSAAFQSLIGTF